MGGSPTVSNKMTHKEFLAAFQVSMSFLKFCIDGTPGTPGTQDDNMRCSRTTQVCHFWGESIKGGQYVAAPLASDFCKSDHLQLSISHFWPFNVAKCCQRNSRDNGP